jgi:tight adherence protein C
MGNELIVLLPILAFVCASLLVAAGAMYMAPSAAAAIERRLGEIRGASMAEPAPRYRQNMAAAFTKLSQYAPASPAEMGKLRARLVTAGYRQPEALAVFVGFRLGAAMISFALVALPIFGRGNVLMAFGAAALGYLLPGMVLAKLAARRQHRIRLSLPDALDLLVVSVEAGLGLDQALQRVGDELAFAHRDLSEELRLVNLELRAGKARSEALHNLALRTGVDDLSSLVAMLVQTDKFGTSVAQSLRVHSDTLRTKRRQRAEEAAAKTGVKMVFPLVFCIFPAIWVVTIGPAAIKIVQVLFPMANK